MDVIRDYHENEQLKEEYCLINNKKEGLYKEYYKNGQICEICNYVGGQINGGYNRKRRLIKIYVIAYKNGKKY